MSLNIKQVILIVLLRLAVLPIHGQSTSASGNLALNSVVTVDSVYQNNPTYAASFATDGNDLTRWASAANAGTHWIQIDLGTVQPINQVQINWETAYGVNYTIATSTNGTTWQTNYTEIGNTNAGFITHNFSTIYARYVWINCTQSALGSNISVYELRVYYTADDTGDLALGVPVTADSVYNTNYASNFADDGNNGTRWSSAANAGTHWIQFDLGEIKAVNQVQINWQAAYGVNYTIKTSTNGANWTIAATITGNTNTGLVLHSFSTQSARYIQLNCTTAAGGANISIYDFQVYSGNLALNRTVTVDSTYSSSFEGYMAVDGNLSTRWASAANAGTHWITVDLGEVKLIRQVQIDWEYGSGANYTIQLSTNGTSWTTNAAIIGNGSPGWISHNFDEVPARYVQVNCTTATYGADISIYELYIGTADSTSLAAFTTKIANSSPYFLGANGYVSNSLAAIMNPQYTNAGFDRMRGTINFQNIIPTNLCASLADYTNNVNNIQNPTNWDFNGLYWIDDATNYGFKILTVFAYTPQWLSYNTNWNGVPMDWAVWQDICNKVYSRYTNEITWIEPWNEIEYFCDLTGSPYTNADSFQADLYYNTVQAVRAARGGNAQIGGFALSWNDLLTTENILQIMISRYGHSWANTNLEFYSFHNYWGDPTEVDVLSPLKVLQDCGLGTNVPIFLTEWNYPYWWPDTGEVTDQEAIGFIGKGLTKALKRGMATDYYAVGELTTPTNTLYSGAAAGRIAGTQLGLNRGSCTVYQTTDCYIDSVAAVNTNGAPVVYISNYSPNGVSKRVYLQMTGLTNNSVSGSVYLGSINNSGSNVCETFSMAVTNTTAMLQLDMPSNSVMGVTISGSCISTNSLTNSIVSNIATTSSQSVSSTYPGYDAYMAVDGIEKVNNRGEWASDGELNPWIELSWPTNMSVNKVILMDRPNLIDSANSGVLYFSDGSNVPVPFVANDGSSSVVMFPTKSVTWVKFQVTGGTGVNVGLSEFKVFGSMSY